MQSPDFEEKDEYSSGSEMDGEDGMNGGIASGSGGDKPYKCSTPGCLKRYRQMNGLKYHLAKGQCSLIANGMTEEETEAMTKPFVCPISYCGKRYKNGNGLRYHLQHTPNHSEIENQERPFACMLEGCGRRFKTSAGLNSHYITSASDHGSFGILALAAEQQQQQSSTNGDPPSAHPAPSSVKIQPSPKVSVFSKLPHHNTRPQPVLPKYVPTLKLDQELDMDQDADPMADMDGANDTEEDDDSESDGLALEEDEEMDGISVLASEQHISPYYSTSFNNSLPSAGYSGFGSLHQIPSRKLSGSFSPHLAPGPLRPTSPMPINFSGPSNAMHIPATPTYGNMSFASSVPSSFQFDMNISSYPAGSMEEAKLLMSISVPSPRQLP